MRDINCRAKRVKDGQWVYGAYHKHLPYTPAPIRDKPVPEEDYEHCIIQDGFSDWNMPRGFDGFAVEPDSVGQYTGLKDKNGVEIYEGDIVRVEPPAIQEDNFATEVVWDSGAFHFKKLDGTLNRYYNYGLKVIGNVYENKDLLA